MKRVDGSRLPLNTPRSLDEKKGAGLSTAEQLRHAQEIRPIANRWSMPSVVSAVY